MIFISRKHWGISLLSLLLSDLEDNKKFVKNVVTKKDATPFKVPKSINLVMVDAETGLQPDTNTKKIIYESFKEKDNFIVNLDKMINKDKLNFDSKNQNKIFRFY